MKVPQIPALPGCSPLGFASAIVDGELTEVAHRMESGRWFIAMGQPGFNSPANNRDGYASEASAIAASRRYAAKGAKHRAGGR